MEPFTLRGAFQRLMAWDTREERLSIAGNHIVGGHRKGSFGRTVFELTELLLRRGHVGSGAIHGMGYRSELFHEANQPPEVFFRQRPGFHAVDDHLPVLLGAMTQ